MAILIPVAVLLSLGCTFPDLETLKPEPPKPQNPYKPKPQALYPKTLNPKP